MKPENRFIAGVHKELHADVYREKMFNPMRGGTPDCYYMGFEDDLWVEYKYVQKFSKTIKPALSPLQLVWLMRAADRDRKPWVVVGSPTGAVLLDDPAQWVQGVFREDVPVLTKQELARSIEARCGLEPSGREQRQQGTSTRRSSSSS